MVHIHYIRYKQTRLLMVHTVGMVQTQCFLCAEARSAVRYCGTRSAVRYARRKVTNRKSGVVFGGVGGWGWGASSVCVCACVGGGGG